jgi:RNA polymerase sigma-70 factor, ECF subfamily
MSEQDDEDKALDDLIRRAQQGDRAAQDRLFDRYRPQLHLQAERKLGRRPLGGINASDVVQETLLRAYDHLGDMEKSGRPELESWLQRILKNTIIQGWRGATRKKRDAQRDVPLDDAGVGELAAAQRSPSQAAARSQEWVRVLQSLSQLPEGQRQAVWLRHVEELSLAEIAGRMGRTELATASLIKRGMEALRAELGELADQVQALAAQQRAPRER